MTSYRPVAAREKIRDLTKDLPEDVRDEIDGLLAQVAELRAHHNAEFLRTQARKIEDEIDGLTGEVYEMRRHGARQLRFAANAIDPYDLIAGTDIQIRRSDGRAVRLT